MKEFLKYVKGIILFVLILFGFPILCIVIGFLVMGGVDNGTFRGQ